jgi:hypothetical protein
LSLGLHGDDFSRPRCLELEVGVARDGHELYITWPPHDDMLRPGQVDHLESERFGVVVACISEGDTKSNPPKGDGLLARDHSIEWMWATLELISGKP